MKYTKKELENIIEKIIHGATLTKKEQRIVRYIAY